MRFVGLSVTLMLLLQAQPAQAAFDCRIDLSDPTNPRIYGDCLGASELVVLRVNDDGATVGTHLLLRLTLGELVPGGCNNGQQAPCYVAQNQEFTLVLEDDGLVVHHTSGGSTQTYALRPHEVVHCEWTVDPDSGTILYVECG